MIGLFGVCYVCIFTLSQFISLEFCALYDDRGTYFVRVVVILGYYCLGPKWANTIANAVHAVAIGFRLSLSYSIALTL